MKQHTEKQPRVHAFIDSQNLNIGIQKSGWKMDWRKFRKFLADKYGVSKAYMFIGYIPENEDLYEQMHQAGYAVVLKPTFDMTRPQPEMMDPKKDEPNQKGEAEDKKPVKGNIDAELVLWAMKEMSNYEKAIIVSGDGDFYCLVEYLDQKGRLLNLFAPSQQYSNLYNRYEKYIVRLDQFRRELAYHDRRRFGDRRKSEKGVAND
ncbi:MAG: NYN domain-containing protein [Candidatus Saccharimonadales bacterium]